PSSLRPHSSFLFYYTSYISIYTLSLHDALPIYLMMPGMGLTAIGLAGVILSYMGIANTFLTGMQALSGLTMFVGLVFLSAGILKDRKSTRLNSSHEWISYAVFCLKKKITICDYI